MYRTIYNLIKAIKEKQLVHMKYEMDGNESGNIKILPLHFFEYKETYYLAAKTLKDNQCKTFRLDRICSIETSFFILEDNITLDTALSEASYISELIRPINLEDDKEIATIHKYYGENSKKSANNRHEQILQYYIAAMNKDNLKLVTIDFTQENNYAVAGANCIKMMKNPSETVSMPDGFREFYGNYSNLKNTSLFLGYPLLTTDTGEHLPFLYCEVVVEEETNSIKLKQEKFFINKRFASESLEYTLEDGLLIVEQLISGNIHLDGLGDKFKWIVRNHRIFDKGVLFFEKPSNANYSMIQEFKRYMRMDGPFSVPYQKIIEPGTPIKTKDDTEFIVSPVLINYKQRETVMKSTEPLLLCQGPPGTGKTQTIVNIIANEVLKGNTILVASTNNKAVDNVMDKLKGKNTLFSGALRLGDQDKRKEAKDEVKTELEKIVLAPGEDMNQKKEEVISKSAELDRELSVLLEQLHLLRNYTTSRNALIEAIRYTTSLFSVEEYKHDYTLLLGGIGSQPEEEKINTVVHELDIITLEIENAGTHSYSKVKFLNWIIKMMTLRKYKKHIESLGLNIEELKDKKSYDDFSISLEHYKNGLRLLMLEIEKEKLEEQISKLDSTNESDIQNKISPKLNEKIEKDTKLMQLLDEDRKTKLTEEELEQLKSILPEEAELNHSKETFNILTKLFPVILCTNQSIPKSIPIDYEFDLVIIDEASQCTIPVSLSAIKRAKRLLVVGDDKQLKPVVGLSSEWDELLLEEHRIKMEEMENSFYKYSSNSLFDYYKNTLKLSSQMFLNEHFRCQQDIIQFSNQEFYHNNLIISSKPIDTEPRGIHMMNVSTKDHPVDYFEMGNKNPYEVEAIINYIETYFGKIKTKTVGIISPFVNQYKYLKEVLEEKIKDDKTDIELKEFYSKLLKERSVGSVHTFQGGEKDIIFFSTVVGFGMTKSLDSWLNSEENLINVANTRAIETLILVGDMEFLNISGGILKKFAEYVENIAQSKEKPKMKGIFPIVHQVVYEKDVNERVRRLLNGSEKIMFNIIKEILKKNFPQYDVYPKVRVADVIVVDDKTERTMSSYIYSYALKSHFDFIIFHKQSYVPKLAYEFDGPDHDKPENKKKDDMKDELCKNSNFMICRYYYKNKKMEDVIFQNLMQILKG
ncbi:AAA domain-containing protein [Peribacillus loiseleuriae]|uniref:AAA domain-containing protein n=1 Tax=Peribacillus loiseleuriae TaxID=1679170 RepID=UPI003D036412